MTITMMASTNHSSTLLLLSGASSSSVSSLKPRSTATSSSSSIIAFPSTHKYNPFPSPSSSTSRKWCPVRAAVVRENKKEKKVVVEESFEARTSTLEYARGDTPQNPSSSSSSSSSTSSSQTWVVTLEQSINVFLTDSVIKILDTLYHDRDYARFYVLETIARVPYFAFMSVLHMYESFGWWRRADYLKVHFAESWNEMHHLLIMEELGGNAWWFDRFLAQHIAFFYYVMTVFMYALSPRMAYHFSECVESHAFETYDKFIKAKEEDLKKLPAPEVAVKYYTGDDLYLFGEFPSTTKA
ncbi:hypothetical protein Tsubulata_033947 [Turnera subulata]|uniref:Ubiquinol oxidase n=1 Tax=Turnera subulata TaxID=218843 RepID=A0A9Q0FFU0_9ROSI|nr:hypothetical protein Tsubulata_033947 [Turnera subulata]